MLGDDDFKRIFQAAIGVPIKILQDIEKDIKGRIISNYPYH